MQARRVPARNLRFQGSPPPTNLACLAVYNTPSDPFFSIQEHKLHTRTALSNSPASRFLQIIRLLTHGGQMAATLKLRILAVAVAAASLVATASAAEAPAPAPTSGASMAAPAVAAASLTALVFGYLF
ncbi:hypothetical protein BAE44_0001967 [Dichanthelium oligosanthes]|uniref:Uncharacterized protein n=1 Tax=Dichanthelium oligosanthes TaxID=888268 RepID=A0A1E5WI55_9POAL|nr:hypothetical protein BAE44_0001967 [Dichanthelium oligosanthes]